MSTQQPTPEDRNTHFTVLSPDGFSIACDADYARLDEAREALAQWCRRYEAQGYYRDNRWEMIALAELPDRCRIVPLTDALK